MATEFAQMAVDNLRHVNDYNWALITLLLITVHLYAQEVQKKTGVVS